MLRAWSDHLVMVLSLVHFNPLTLIFCRRRAEIRRQIIGLPAKNYLKNPFDR